MMGWTNSKFIEISFSRAILPVAQG